MFAVETRLHQIHVGEVVAGSARMSALFLNATLRLTFALALFTGLATIGRYPTRARYSGRRHFRRRIRIAYEVQSEGVPFSGFRPRPVVQSKLLEATAPTLLKAVLRS